MPSRPFDERIPNRDSAETVRLCDYCADTGFVAVASYPTVPFTWKGKHHPEGEGGMVEAMGPCPHCERGYDLDFPSKKGKPVRGHWGMQGYWHGRDSSIVQPFSRPPERLTKKQKAENARMAKLISETLKPVE